ncbi:MAG: transposase [Zavarzinella sp.]
MLGGKALVAVNLSTGLVMEMASELDGEASETRLLAPLLQQLKDHCGEKLIVADRCYGFYKHIAMIKDDGCHFVLRVASITQFIQDPEKPARIGKDRYGRKLIEEHGWITSQKNTKLIAVRRLSIIRDKVQIQLLTDLTDSKRYPADDIAEIYRYRWDIERVYATITKVFQLRHLIGTSPEAGLIQASLCLILFNITEAIKWHISVGNGKKIDEVSGEMLWRDIRDEVMAATRLLRTRDVQMLLQGIKQEVGILERLTELLGNLWKKKWAKSKVGRTDPTKIPNPKPQKLKQTTCHDSVFRVMKRAKK